MNEDGYGRMLLDALDGKEPVEIVERDDGFINASVMGPGLYLAPFRRWPAHHRGAMRFVRGRVLDVGCGAGRVCLHVQERGGEAVGIDVSPGAIEVCRRRGVVDARLMPAEEIDDSLGRFDTVVFFGNNIGLLADAEQGPALLRRLHEITTDRGRIVGESRDVTRSQDPLHLAYQAENRRRGRLPGQLTIRVRYRDAATPWFDYLMVSPTELERLVDGTGWRLARTIDSDDTYIAILEKS